MTRKRFIKLLMSQGYDRNKANEIANEARSRKVPYATFYYTDAQARLLSSFGFISIDEARRAFLEAAKTMQRIASGFAAGVEAFSRAFSNAMSESE